MMPPRYLLTVAVALLLASACLAEGPRPIEQTQAELRDVIRDIDQRRSAHYHAEGDDEVELHRLALAVHRALVLARGLVADYQAEAARLADHEVPDDEAQNEPPSTDDPQDEDADPSAPDPEPQLPADGLQVEGLSIGDVVSGAVTVTVRADVPASRPIMASVTPVDDGGPTWSGSVPDVDGQRQFTLDTRDLDDGEHVLSVRVHASLFGGEVVDRRDVAFTIDNADDE
ncbi:hypothetical protein ACERK3_09465 [Phycisphaerales bacterium AB-hyl4]|uniref:Ig-like domain-containing protein n=1 Tax=Natronomicrosphaera hydrolytica TaxID=3242702 RepID=A0ABV4U8C0_9BACT